MLVAIDVRKVYLCILCVCSLPPIAIKFRIYSSHHFNQIHLTSTPSQSMSSSVSSSDWNPLSSHSSSNWSPSTSQRRCNARWELWEKNSHDCQVHNPMQNPVHDTSSSNWSPQLSERRYNREWEQWQIESSDADHTSHQSGDEDYKPSQNCRPGPSNYQDSSRENSTPPQNKKDPTIGMLPSTWLFFTFVDYIHTI